MLQNQVFHLAPHCPALKEPKLIGDSNTVQAEC